MIDVRPLSSRSSACSISTSVGRSMFEVASSRMRIRGSASSARAIEMSWRSPADRPAAALAHLVVEPAREPRRDPVDADRRGRRLDLLVRRVGLREADVRRDRAAEEERILQHDAELAPVRAELHVAQVERRRRAPRPRPGRRSGRSRRASVDLPPPDSPTSAKQAPGSDVELDAVQDRLLAVGEDDAVDLEVAFDARQRVASRPVLDVRLLVEDASRSSPSPPPPDCSWP